MKRIVGGSLSRFGPVMIGITLLLVVAGTTAVVSAFPPGELFVSFENGSVQRRNADGTFPRVLMSTVPGPAEGMGFDPGGNLYVTRWCTDWTFCVSGNTVEKFDANGISQGTFGRGQRGFCLPHALAFDAAGNVYIGQAGCGGNVLQFSAAGAEVAAYAVATENAGSFWVDLGVDGCTLFYTSWGPNVKRFNVCTNQQLTDFNRAPLPGGETQGLRVLPDGGVLVSSGAVVARLDASGNLVQTYGLPTGERQYWVGLDLVGDGTFWAVNYYPSGIFNANVYRFDLTVGQVRASFDTGTPPEDVVDIRVSPGQP